MEGTTIAAIMANITRRNWNGFLADRPRHRDGLRRSGDRAESNRTRDRDRARRRLFTNCHMLFFRRLREASGGNLSFAAED